MTDTLSQRPSDSGRAGPPGGRWRLHLRVVGLAAVVAMAVSLAQWRGRAPSRDASLVAALQSSMGLHADVDGVLWLEAPPFGVWRAAAGTVVAIVRAAPGPEEPHDIYVVHTRLSPEGVLLGVGSAYNLTETSAVDEQRPVGSGARFAFGQQELLGEAKVSGVRLYDLLAGPGSEGVFRVTGAADEPWSRLQQAQAAITRLQQTGQLGGVGRWDYVIQPPADEVELSFTAEQLVIGAGDRTARVPLDEPTDVPEWLLTLPAVESKPGNLVTWAVNRVRAIPWVGDTTMQYVKAVAFTVLDLILRNTEAVTGDTGAGGIADDLGQESLAAPTRIVPVDPKIGFPPPPLEPWLKRPLPGEGQWTAKDQDPFIQTMPGLPPVFYTTFIRSDRDRQATRVYIALWDPRVVELHTMAGIAEPKSATGRTGPGLIPRAPEVMGRLAAALNAGFQSLHGEFGMMSDGVIYLPPKPYGATVGVLQDGSTAFGSWPRSPAIPDDMRSFRQNLTVMVQDQKFNPYKRTWWGGTPPEWEDRTHTVRTGICLTKENFVGYFYGMDLSPKALSQSMIQARCAFGMALDMNAGHSGLEFYRAAPKDQMEPLGRPLRGDWERTGKVPKMDGWEFRAKRLIRGMGLMYFPRYIKREGRDFFYLTLRHLLPGPPLVTTAAPGAEPVAWRVEGLPQQGYPYALAVAEVPLRDGCKARVLKVDPRMVTPFHEHAKQPGGGGPGGGERSEDGTEHADAGVPDGGAADGGGAPADDSPSAPVLVLDPGALEGDQSVWFTPNAFVVAAEPPRPGAVRLASGAPAAAPPPRAVAVLGVQDEAGMLVYVEAVCAPEGGDGAVASDQLLGIVSGLGASWSVVLPQPLPLALGGDTDLAGAATRLRPSAATVRLLRKEGPGPRRIFLDTPVVPFWDWYPLQAKRIRYFKKKKKKKD